MKENPENGRKKIVRPVDDCYEDRSTFYDHAEIRLKFWWERGITVDDEKESIVEATAKRQNHVLLV